MLQTIQKKSETSLKDNLNENIRKLRVCVKGKKESEPEQIKFHSILRDEGYGMPLVKAAGISALAHPVAIFILISLLSFFGTFAPIKKKIPADIKFILAKNIKEQEPITKTTKFRSDKNLRAGGENDQTKKVIVPKKPKKHKVVVAKAKLKPVIKKPVEKKPEPKLVEKPVIKPEPKSKPVLESLQQQVVKTFEDGKFDFNAKLVSVGTENGEKGGRAASVDTNLSGNGDELNPGPGNPDGPPGIDAVKAVNFGPYMDELNSSIRCEWCPPSGRSTKRVVLSFKIDKDGDLKSLKVQSSSGVPRADRAAINAVKRAKPFKPLPEEYDKEYLAVKFVFDSNVFNLDGKKIY